VNDNEDRLNKRKRTTTARIFSISSVLASVISVPALGVTLILHYIFKLDTVLTLAVGFVVLFIAMGFGYKISPRFVSYKNNRKSG
jgi:hypothetical protein